MPNYRRAYIPGETFFLTIVTYQRKPIFNDAENISRLRQAIKQVKREYPFDFSAAVVMPDHLHFLWSLPRADTSYSRRIGRMKVLFTQMLRGRGSLPSDVGISRQKHRESDVWQRRFWEHVIEDEDDLEKHPDYIHYNPVKHGLAACPHAWPYSSFRLWAQTGWYDSDWGCCCGGRQPRMTVMERLEGRTGE